MVSDKARWQQNGPMSLAARLWRPILESGLSDTSFALEQQFGVRLDIHELRNEWNANGNDCTAGRLHEMVCDKCRDSGIPVPRSSWNRVRVALVRTLGVAVAEVKKDAWLRKDLECD
jgi:hypothetical protein